MVAAVTLTFGGVAALLDVRAGTTYTITTPVRVGSVLPEGSLLGIPPPRPQDGPEVETARTSALVAHPKVLRRVPSIVHRDHPETVPSGQPVAAPLSPGLIAVGVRHTDPVVGERTAQALAESLVVFLRRDARRGLRLIGAKLREADEAESEGPPDVAALRGQLTRERLQRELDIAQDVTDPAAVVGAPSVRKDGGALAPLERVPPAIILGLSLSIVAALLLDAVERRPRDPRRLAEAVGLPVAAVLPRFAGAGGEHHAFGGLRAAVETLTGGERATVLVTSADQAEGKTTVALGLATFVARAGREAYLVEADLRRPSLRSWLGLSGPGLAELLAEDPRSGDAAGDGQEVSIAADPGSLRALPAGDPPGRPGDLLRSDALGDLLARAADESELVVIDAPPALAGTDVGLLLPHVDLVLICARAGRTPTDRLGAALQALERAGAPRVALVVGGARAADIPGWGPSVSRQRSRMTAVGAN